MVEVCCGSELFCSVLRSGSERVVYPKGRLPCAHADGVRVRNDGIRVDASGHRSVREDEEEEEREHDPRESCLPAKISPRRRRVAYEETLALFLPANMKPRKI